MNALNFCPNSIQFIFMNLKNLSIQFNSKKFKKIHEIHYKMFFKNWVISMFFPIKLHLSAVTKSAPEENALSADTLEACTVK